MSNKTTNIIAVILLTIMFAVSILSIKDDALTFDELAHLPAGYSYLTQKDYRLNPEHPPLVKDLAAIPLLFLDLNFPEESSSWQEGSQGKWWVQFNFGSEFLYRSGNDADKIIFWGKIPMILLLIFLGWFLFRWARKLGSNKTALLVLTIFSFSPTFIAHGGLVTTDVAAALGAVLTIYYYLKFLKNPNKKNIIIAGIVLGISLLFKFSLILLFPLLAAITLVFAGLKEGSFIKNTLKYVILAMVVVVIGVLGVIWPVYQYHILDYPPDLQFKETEAFLITTTIPKSLINLNLQMVKNPILRPLSQYSLGLLMATNRTTTGNTTYFLGMVSAAGWWFYFPIVYFLKVPLALHILILISIFSSAAILKPFWQTPFSRLKEWIKNHFAEFTMMVFLLIYWITSMTGSLNIGIRHLLPSFPFIYLLVCLGINNWLKGIKKAPSRKVAAGFVSILLLWYVISSLMVFPHYLSYFNESVGGAKNGYRYVVDSNLDWGQDLKRLKSWMNSKGINSIYIDHFGGGDLDYYLKDRHTRWQGTNSPNDFPKGNYLAVSASQLQGGRGIPASDYDRSTDFYMWLNDYKPVKIIGNSIFIYYID